MPRIALNAAASRMLPPVPFANVRIDTKSKKIILRPSKRPTKTSVPLVCNRRGQLNLILNGPKAVRASFVAAGAQIKVDVEKGYLLLDFDAPDVGPFKGSVLKANGIPHWFL